MAKDRRKAGSKGPKGSGAGPQEPAEDAASAATGSANAPDAPIVPPRPGGSSAGAAPSERGPDSSGSIDVQFSNPRLPLSADVADALGEPTDMSRAPTTDASLSAHGPIDRIDDRFGDEDFDPHALTDEPEHQKSSARIVAKRAEVLIGQGVSRIGDGIGSLGEGVSKIGERAATKVPVLGESVKQIGEGLTELGASLHDLPAVTQSKSGRILVRSMLVAFVLVFAWIAGIVLLQLRDSKKPDFRPLARKILIAVRDGHESTVWAEASPRFQEVVREQRFIDDMADMKRTLGAFREISAVNDTIVTTGASGRIGRVALMLQFDNGRARANVSFHRDAGRWKLLGLAVDTPPELPITQESRKERSELPEEVMGAAIKVLQAGNVEEASSPPAGREGREGRDGRPARSGSAAAAAPEEESERRSEEIWDQGSKVFHSAASKTEFVRLQRERHAILGNFVRVIEYRGGSKKYGELSATFTGLVEYQTGVVTASLNFGRLDERAPWLLNSFKVVLPMPRPDEIRPDDVRPSDRDDDGTGDEDDARPRRPRNGNGGGGDARDAGPPAEESGTPASTPGDPAQATPPAPAPMPPAQHVLPTSPYAATAPAAPSPGEATPSPPPEK